MKMSHVALAAALAVLASAPVLAQTSVTLYGIADGGVSYVSGIDSAKTRVVSGIMEGSRWGLRGNEDMGGGWRAVFTLENRFELDTGELGNRPLSGDQVPEFIDTAADLGLTGAFQPIVNAVNAQILSELGVNVRSAEGEPRYFDRQAFIGLVTPVGAILAGRQYTPGYEVSATFETMHTESSLAFGQIAAVPPAIEIRSSNTLAYRIQLGGLTASAMYGFGEGSTRPGGRLIAVMGMYKTEDYGFGAAYQTRENEFGDKSLTNLVVGGLGKIGPGTLHAEYIKVKDDAPTGLRQISDRLAAGGFDPQVIIAPVIDAYSTALSQDANAYHVGYKLSTGPHTISVAYNYFDDRRDLNADVQSYGAVYSYSFSKRTDVNFVLTRFQNNDTAQAAPGNAGYFGGFTSEAGRDSTNVAMGLRHRF